MNLGNLLISMLGASALPIIEEIEIEKLQTTDRAGIVRLVTLPEHTVDQILKKTHGDKAAVMAARAKFGEDFADFVLSFAPAPAGD